MSVVFFPREKNHSGQKGASGFFPHLPPKVVGGFFPSAAAGSHFGPKSTGMPMKQMVSFISGQNQPWPAWRPVGGPGLEKWGWFFSPTPILVNSSPRNQMINYPIDSGSGFSP